MAAPQIGTPTVVQDQAGAHVTVTVDVTDGTSPLTLTAATPGGSSSQQVDVTPPVPRWSAVYGAAPTANPVVVSGPMLLDIDATVNALTIADGGTLTFDPATTLTLQSKGNVVADGTLRMRPATATVVHTLRFINVNEAGFVGGDTHVPLDTDTGLWMTSHTTNAHLDLAGTPKRGWTRLTGPATVGATTLTVTDATGWRAGDTVAVAPTALTTVTGTPHYDRYDRKTIATVTGGTVTLTGGLTYDHPTCTTPDGHVWAAEVVNLTRNVRVEGTTGGRAHVLVHGGKVDTFNHVELSYLGPRKPVTGQTYTDPILGRYGLHFHHNHDVNTGLTLTGVVAHDLGNHGFVPHGSNGITFTDCAVWDCFEEAFWWDQVAGTDESNDITYDQCAAGRVRSDPTYRGYLLAGFALSFGLNLTIRDCATFGVRGNSTASGYQWPEGASVHDVWAFQRNVAHNNAALGAYAWQNETNSHDIQDLTTYRCTLAGLFHGAYANVYHYTNFQSAEHGGTNPVDLSLHAASHTQSGTGRVQRFDGGSVGHLWIDRHNVATPGAPGIFQNVDVGRITVKEASVAPTQPGIWDFIECGLAPSDVTIVYMHPQSVLRIQTGSQAWRVTAAGTTTIPLFA